MLAASGGGDLGDPDRVAFQLIDAAQEVGVRQVVSSCVDGDDGPFGMTSRFAEALAEFTNIDASLHRAFRGGRPAQPEARAIH